MAVIGTGVPTLLDIIQRLNPDGTQARIAEVLTKNNPILEDMPWMAGNLPTGHRYTTRTSLPTPSWRAINEGVPVTKSSTAQNDEACGLLEDFSQIDRELLMIAPDPAGARVAEAAPHLEGMNQAMATQLFYGNVATNPKAFTGFAPRLGSLSSPIGSQQIIDAGGTGSNLRSIWLIGWGEGKVYGIYPKNAVGGLSHEDATSGAGKSVGGLPPAMTLRDPSGNPFMGYMDHWTWRCGLAVQDWRYVVRIANIDETLLKKDKSTGADLQDLMILAQERIQSLTGVNAVFYTDRLTQAFLRRQVLQVKNGFLDYSDVAGRKILQFGETPVKRTDALNIAETRVV